VCSKIFLEFRRQNVGLLFSNADAGEKLVSYAYLLSGLSPHVRYAYFGQEFLSSKLANHSFTHEGLTFDLEAWVIKSFKTFNREHFISSFVRTYSYLN
jgi:hypothetical protein